MSDADTACIIDGGELGLTVCGNRWDLIPEPGRPPHASVIIPFFEQHVELDRVLAGLSLQRGQVVIDEVIVVDDGSRRAPTPPPTIRVQDGTDTFRDVVVLVLRQDDRGRRPAAARNLGASRASGEVLVFFDGDTVPDPLAVARLAALPAVAPEAVVVGRREYCNFDGWRAQDVRAWLGGGGRGGPDRYDAPRWLADGYAASENLLEIDDRSYQFVIGAIMATSSRFFQEIGGFDGSIDCYGGEDWEFAYRAWCRGALLAHRPDAVGYHHGPDWRGREGDAATKNPERLAVARRIPGRDDAIRGPFVRVVATVRCAASDDATLATVAAVLRAGGNQIAVALDGASAVVAEVVRHDSRVRCGAIEVSVIERTILQVEVAAPCRLTTDSLEELVRLIVHGGDGEIVVDDDAGTLLIARSTRALARARRWSPVVTNPDQSAAELIRRRSVAAESLCVERLTTRIDLDQVFTR